MDEVANNAEKILVMNNGSIEMIDSVKNVFNNSSILKNIGLNVPQITGIFFELKKSGYDVDTSIFSIKDAAKEIERLYYKEKK